MIISRPFWQDMIEKAWGKRTIIWLMGLRRVGKTSLCQSLKDVEYFDCESPRVRHYFTDPEGFLEGKRGKRIILDEIHRLDNPSEVLKLAADHYPDIKIIATGSSTLGASVKFRDTLTGRKIQILLTPLFLQEMALFGDSDIRHRFLFGGFPAFFGEKKLPEEYFNEWIDSYWAKDIQELFKVEKRAPFLKFANLLLAQSGGMFEASRFSDVCEVSRQTINNYLQILEETFFVHVVRPYSTHKSTEIVKAPKVYGFDTGFVCYAKGRRELREEDLGFMWEHCVLNEIQGHLQTQIVNYWRDQRNHEMDFVISDRAEQNLTAIECKFTSFIDDVALSKIGKNFEAFRKIYPEGDNLIVSSNVEGAFTKKYKDLTITFVSISGLIARLKKK